VRNRVSSLSYCAQLSLIVSLLCATESHRLATVHNWASPFSYCAQPSLVVKLLCAAESHCLAAVRNESYRVATCATGSHRLARCRAQLSLIILLLCANELLSSVRSGHIMPLWLKLLRESQQFPGKKRIVLSVSFILLSSFYSKRIFTPINTWWVTLGMPCKNRKGPQVKCPLSLSDFNQNWIFSTKLYTTFQHQIAWKSFCNYGGCYKWSKIS